jgi:hypothetical protein
MTTEETKTNITQELSNDIFDLKEKLTDNEFKSIMEKLSKLNTEVKKRFYKITYITTEFSPDCANYWDCNITKKTKYYPSEKLPTDMKEDLERMVDEDDLFRHASDHFNCILQDDAHYKIHAEEDCCENGCSTGSKWITKKIVIIKVEKE